MDMFVHTQGYKMRIQAGSTEITGDFTIEEADDLANILKSGKLPAPARIISDTVVGPTLGKEAINSGFISFFVAFALVLGFMIFYYSKSAGTIADIALFVNLFLMFGVLASLNAVLSLPGIAGIVLTMGMDVDANILIFERTREELRGGKGIKLALADGYKRAYPAIIDSKANNYASYRYSSLRFRFRPNQKFCNNSCYWYYDFNICFNIHYKINL
jgi:SecD/SecF fusion protein